MSDTRMLALLRRDERRQMRSRCTINRPQPDHTGVLVYQGRCKVRPALQATRQVDYAQQAQMLHLFQVKVPYDTNVQRGDVVTVTQSRDPQMAGRHFVVREVDYDDWQVSRVLVCTDPRRADDGGDAA